MSPLDHQFAALRLPPPLAGYGFRISAERMVPRKDGFTRSAMGARSAGIGVADVGRSGPSYRIELAIIADDCATSPPFPPALVGQPWCPFPYPNFLLFGQPLHSGEGEVLNDIPDYPNPTFA